MSIEKTTVQHRKFVVKAGMTAEDVKKSKDATALQKKYANVFDSDGQKGFSQKEADLFNATTFSEKADGSVMFWTRQKDGTKKGTKMTGDVKDMHYATKKEVKPYVTTKKVAKKTVKQPKQEEVSFWDSKWSGHQIAKLTGENDFTDWLQDKDKVCTDGKDDGKIGFWEGAKSLAKGLIGGIPKAMINHPITTAVTVGLGAAATVLTGGAILPVLGAVGVASGIGMAGYGTYKAATAKTDGEAKQALETLGMGVATTVLSSASAGKALETAKSAGVKSAEVAEDANILTKTAQMFKATPEALKMSGVNAKANVMTWTTGTVQAHSNTLKGANEYMSKPNDVKAYRFNPNGTTEEILTNNPGVFRGADGKYYLPNKWNPNEPYLIDTSKEQMIMLYGGDDMAVCDGAVFKGSYVDTQSYKASGAKNYQNPSSLEYGKIVDVTKQAPGAFKVVPEGTKIKTLEGVRTVKKGEVVALDHEGNPYVTTPANIVKRNEGLTRAGIKDIAKVDKDLAATVVRRNELKEQILPKIPENLRGEASKLIDANTRAEMRPYGEIRGGYECAYSLDAEETVKIDLLKAHGIKFDFSIYDWDTVDKMYIEENGVTHAFNRCQLADGFKWIDAKLAELAK